MDSLGHPDVNGFVNLMGVGSYEIENCGIDCHVLVKVMTRNEDGGLPENSGEAEDKDLSPQAGFLTFSFCLAYSHGS